MHTLVALTVGVVCNSKEDGKPIGDVFPCARSGFLKVRNIPTSKYSMFWLQPSTYKVIPNRQLCQC